MKYLFMKKKEYLQPICDYLFFELGHCKGKWLNTNYPKMIDFDI